MNKKVKLLMVYNTMFYIFILVHKFYLDDYVPQVFFYMSLAFSSMLMEEVFRSKIKELKLYTVIDFFVRIIILSIHFITLISGINIKLASVITLIFWIFNTIIEVIILKVTKTKEIDIEFIKKEEIDKFIEDFNSKKLNYFIIGTNLVEEIKTIINALTVSGKSTILIVILSILAFISRFIYEHFMQFIFIPILIIVFLLYVSSKLSYKINKVIYDNYNDQRRKSKIDNITFTIGYTILFCYSVFLYDKLGYFNISMLVLGALFWIPIFNTKYKLKKKIENAYKKYKKLIL